MKNKNLKEIKIAYKDYKSSHKDDYINSIENTRKNDGWYSKQNNVYSNDTWIKEKTIIDPEEDSKRLKDLKRKMVKKKEDAATIGILKIKNNKLIIERNMKEIVICDLDDKDAAAAIMASLAKIQLEELTNV